MRIDVDVMQMRERLWSGRCEMRWEAIHHLLYKRQTQGQACESRKPPHGPHEVP